MENFAEIALRFVSADAAVQVESPEDVVKMSASPGLSSFAIPSG